MNKEFENSSRIRASSYLLSLSLYQSLDPSDHAPYINPRKNSKIGTNEILNSGHEFNTALNTMINNLSTINKKGPIRHSASFLLLIIDMIYKIKAKVDQNTVCGNNADMIRLKKGFLRVIMSATMNIQHDSKYCSIALRHGALNGLYRDFLDSVTLLEEFNGIKQAVYVTLADCFCELFELCDKETRDYYAKETSHQRQAKHKHRGLQTMLTVLIYLAHHSKEFCDMFVKNASGKSFIEFLDNTADLPTPWFHLYAKFIYELAQNEPHAVYLHITQDKCEKLTIDAIWQILEKAAQLYLPKQMTRLQAFGDQNVNAMNGSNNPYQRLLNEQRINNMMNNGMGQHEIVWTEPPNMNDMEVRIVCAVLKVLSAMGCIEAVQQQINYQHRPPGIICLLFRLLQCNLPTLVMSNIIACVGAFAVNRPLIADKVWELLERDQVLYTQRQKNQPITKGVELDIIEGEKDGNDAIYPVTVAFCKLLKILLQTTEIPQLLGQGMRGQRPPGIHPYTDYVRDIVFLRWSKREYRHSKEQWELAATALQIFEALLHKFNAMHLTPNANIRYLFTKHPSFELLTLLLAPHSNLIEVILDIYQKAFNIKESETEQHSDDTMVFVDAALKNSLNLIRSFVFFCLNVWMF